MDIKGGAGSGNHGHKGRPGKRGGSGKYGGLRNSHLTLGGKTARELTDQQQLLSDGMAQVALDKFKQAGAHTEMTEKDFNGYLDRLGEHRALILDETLAVANRRSLSPAEQDTLVANLMKHDADKYDWKVAEAYVGSFKMDRGTYEGAFTAAMTNHHLKNPHHWEHHVQSETLWGMKAPPTARPMPRLDYIEMMGDWLGTAREKGTPPAGYYRKFGDKMILNPATRRAVEKDLAIAEKDWKAGQ